MKDLDYYTYCRSHKPKERVNMANKYKAMTQEDEEFEEVADDILEAMEDDLDEVLDNL